MPTKPQPGSVAAKRITTGRLYFQEQITPGVFDTLEYDLGNVVKWKRRNTTETVPHQKSENGVRIVDDEHVHSLAFGYVFNLDEFSPLALEVLQKSSGDADVTQAAVAPGTTVTINDVVQGGTYNVGKTGITIESVKVGATAKTGFTYNPRTGRITITEGGDIADLADIIVTYGAAALNFSRRVSGDKARRVGRMTFFELDQESDVPRAIHTFVGSIWIDADSEQDAATWGSFELNVTCQTPPVIDERKN
ncbi:MAG: hypothetical protein U1G08_17920 [Verrucomicrobiota bacterium]